MTLTDEQLDALADRLCDAYDDAPLTMDRWIAVAEEAARWADEQQGEVVWEMQAASGWWRIPSHTAAAEEAEGRKVRAIRVVATTTKEPSHE